ncbi:MAG: hypothetical protein EU547_07625 [Promethearchaeota archaeon]|nr:MAG: hypothetical protein EU547_07625 [Candidatus Lokiarchaeota archaeon]
MEQSYKDSDIISTSGVFKTSFSVIILVELLGSGIVLILVNLPFLNALYYLITGSNFLPFGLEGNMWFWVWFLVPPWIYLNMFFLFGLVFLISGMIFKLLIKLHSPREGIFQKGSKDWKYFHRRFWTAFFPIWLARAIPFPWADIFVYRLFGVKIGKNVVTYEGYIDPELIEIGDYSMTSLNICIFSHLLYHDKLIIGKVKIGKNCIVGPHSIVSPGTIIEDGAVLGAQSFTRIDQVLEGNLIHIGRPVSKSFPIPSIKSKKVE